MTAGRLFQKKWGMVRKGPARVFLTLEMIKSHEVEYKGYRDMYEGALFQLKILNVIRSTLKYDLTLVGSWRRLVKYGKFLDFLKILGTAFWTI